MTRYEIAANDAARVAEDQQYEIHLFQLPDRTGDEDEFYCAVRPSDELLLTLSQDVYLIEESPRESIDVLNRVLVQVFNPLDLREALIEDGGYEDKGNDGDGELSAEGLNLARSGARLKHRQASRRDPLGVETIGQIVVDLMAVWSGKEATGKPQDFRRPSRTTGTPSRRKPSSKASTRSSSSNKSASRASSGSRTTG